MDQQSNIKFKIPYVRAKIILIGGGSASGKTTIANMLCNYLCDHGITSKCISMDNFYRSLSASEQGLDYNWDDVGALNVDKLLQCISSWKRGLMCSIPRHDFANYRSIENAETVIPARVMIVEGIHALSIERLVETSALKLFVTCDQDEALARRLTRDINERGYDIKTILLRYFKYVKPALTNVILPSQKNADYIITNSDGGAISRNNTVELIGSMVLNELIPN